MNIILLVLSLFMVIGMQPVDAMLESPQGSPKVSPANYMKPVHLRRRRASGNAARARVKLMFEDVQRGHQEQQEWEQEQREAWGQHVAYEEDEDVDVNHNLRIAAATGNVYQVATCLQAGADVCATDDDEHTALHLAVVNRQAAVVTYLLRHAYFQGCLAQLKACTTSQGNTALQLAQYNNLDNIIGYLRKTTWS